MSATIKTNLKIVNVLIFCVLVYPCYGYCRSSFFATELSFKSGFAHKAGDNTLYCLFGNGYIQSPKAEEMNDVITLWISLHPHAQVTIVTTLVTGGNPATLDYIWIEDGSDNLNVFLVRQGMVLASIMIDMVDFVKALPDESRDALFAQSPPQRLVATDMYERFLKEVSEAQDEAKREKRGLWSDRYRKLLESRP